MSDTARLTRPIADGLSPRAGIDVDTNMGLSPSSLGSLPPWLAVVVLSLLVALLYLVRLDGLPLRGEETRRARIAIEMQESGDWIVPRQQGRPLLSRPPLQNWVIAAAGWLRGEVDVWAIRLPSALAVLLTTLLIYFYARGFLSDTGALAAGAAFATMGQVLELGGLGETETLFTLFVSASLLVWHAANVRGWNSYLAWCLPYALVALGLLTKGPQAPVYFALTVGAYLLLSGHWRKAFEPAHFVAIALCFVLWGAWQWPFYRTLGWPAVCEIYMSDVGMRFKDTGWPTIAAHLVSYPAEVLLACVLPWSLLLVAFGFRRFRQILVGARPHLLFLVVAIAVTFPSCWLTPGARGRYYMPLYPCIAILAGVVIDYSWRAAQAEYRTVWRVFLSVASTGMVVCSVGLVVLRLRQAEAVASMSLATVVVLAAAMFLCGLVAYLSQSGSTPRQALAGVLAMAAFTGLMWNGPILSAKIAQSEQATAKAVAAAKALLPPEARLTSLGPADHIFAFYFHEPIEQRAWPAGADDGGIGEYFCYSTRFGECPPLAELPFPYEEVAVVSCERLRSEKPLRLVIVGRRLPTPGLAERPSSDQRR